MKVYLISYDLGIPETSADYQRVIAYIKSYGTWAKPLYSVWFVVTDKTSTQVRDELTQLVDNNDKLLVIEVTNTGGWATWKLSREVTDWMQGKL